MFSSTGVIVETDRISAIVPSGKFFSRGGTDKFFLKAVRLINPGGSSGFEQKIALRRRLAELHTAHTTAVVVAEHEAPALLDLVAQPGLYSLVELKIRTDDLFSHKGLRALLSDLRLRVKNLRGYRGVLGYLLDCPIEPAWLRSRGLEKIQSRLARMVHEIRGVDPHKMVGVKHRTGTVGLALRDEDLLYAVIPSLTPTELRSSLIRLHNLAQARPVVVELSGVAANQDEFVALAFGLGAAGVVVQSSALAAPAAEGFKEGSLSLKMLRASELLPFLALNGACPPKPARIPKVSVIICAYNAERTMRQCLDSLRRLDYPNFEVIIVDDGSRDATPQIAAEFPEFRLIRQPNKGLSEARNVGLHAALGELVAYTDSDCVVDPHWLSFMVRSVVDGELDGCGGPNYGPHEAGWIEGCVAASPGAPSHVLIGDDRAEHLAGCNMLFRKPALQDVGGFDSQFTAAGDDVDICWRLMSKGYLLGYCPSAFVWHFRRNTINAYYRQQRGYGRAEAMLYSKYPERFNVLGQIKWNGTIPGVARTMPGGGGLRVQWVRTTEQFQRVHEMPLGLLAVAPMTAEWSLAAVVLLALSFAFGITIWPALGLLMAGPLWALHYACKASLEKCHRGAASRLLIGWLAYSGSIVRTIARYHWRADARKRPVSDYSVRQKPKIRWTERAITLSYWNDRYTTREMMLENLRRLFRLLGRPVIADRGWNDFDLLVEANLWTRIQLKTSDEELGGLQLRTNVAARLRLSTVARVVLAASIMMAASALLVGPPLAALIGSMITVAAFIGAISGLGRGAKLVYQSIEQCAMELNLVPLGNPVAQPNLTPGPEGAEPERSDEAAPAAGR